jgi:hypothetical protein
VNSEGGAALAQGCATLARAAPHWRGHAPHWLAQWRGRTHLEVVEEQPQVLQARLVGGRRRAVGAGEWFKQVSMSAVQRPAAVVSGQGPVTWWMQQLAHQQTVDLVLRLRCVDPRVSTTTGDGAQSASGARGRRVNRAQVLTFTLSASYSDSRCS